MKSIYLHVFYLSIIAFLGYNYWSSVQAFKAFEHLNVQLNVDYEMMNKTESLVYRSIEKSYKAYPNSISSIYFSKVNIVLKVGNQAVDFIDENKLSLNLDTIHQSNFKTLSPNNSFFNSKKIEEIKSNLMKFQSDLVYLISDGRDKQVIENNLCLTKTIKDESYWNRLKYLPLNGVLVELSALRNQVKADEIAILNFFDSQATGIAIDEDYFKTAIAPKKAALIEGEIFEADIYLTKYESRPNSNVIIKVNGEPLEIKDGVAHFKSKSQTIGTKTIKAEAIIRNPLTGQTTTTEGSFEYQVLPKCSMNCQ
jgi:hypothetical protein